MLGLGTSLSSLYVPQGSGSGNAYSLDFDGTDDYVQWSNSLFQPALRNSFTITMWVNIPSTSEQTWISAWNGSANNFYVKLEGTDLRTYFSSNWDDLIVSSTVTVPTSQWVHFAISCTKTGTESSSSVIAQYINGSKLTTSAIFSTALTAANQGVFNLGSNHFQIGYDPNRTANKMLDDTLVHEFSLHAAVLSENAITTLYNSGGASIDQLENSGDYSNSKLIGYWKLDEGSGTTATDSTAGSVDGTINNGPVWSTSIPGS